MANCRALVNSSLVTEHSDEEMLSRLFIQKANEYFRNFNGKVYAIPSLRKGRDLDIVVWMHFDNCYIPVRTGYIDLSDGSEKEYRLATKKNVWFNSALLVIEVKKHDTSDSIRINNGKLFVKYNDNWKNVSDQSFEQVFALRNYISEWLNIDIQQVPKIQNLLWLYRCPSPPDEYDDVDNVMFGDLDMQKLIQQVLRLRKPVSRDHGTNLMYDVSNIEVKEKLDSAILFLEKEKANGLGIVTRKKLDLVVQNNINVSDQQYFNEIGKKFTIIKGKPGTGKTIHLVQIAYKLGDLKDMCPILLTYNRALVQDIQRMMYYSGFPSSIKINTIHSFFINLFYRAGIIPEENFEYYQFEKYEQHLEELRKLGTQDELRELLQLTYDVLMIDEAQDCLHAEKELFFYLFSYENIVVSYGNKQIVRRDELDWSLGIPKAKRNTKKLEVSHRNKQNLVDFYNQFSIILTPGNSWNLKENRQLTGGKILLLRNTESYQKDVHVDLVSKLIEDECSRYDLMFLTPSKESKTNYADDLAAKLASWEYNSFNGTLECNKRKFFPIDEHRILNYQSCRGLEAWILVCWNLDVILKQIKDNYNHTFDYFQTYEEGLKVHIENWLLMLFTRAIDTLVITLNDSYSAEAQIIFKLAEDHSFSHMISIK